MNSKEKIIRAAVSVFSRRGFYQAGMDEIARVAGVAKGTLYYNFSSKSKLFGAAVTAGMESMMTEVSAELESELPFREHFRRLLQTCFSLYLKHSDLSRIVCNELSSGIEKCVLDEIELTRDRFVGFIAEILEDGQRRGYIKPVDARLAAVGLVGLLDALCNHHLRHSSETNEDELVSCWFEILASGLLT